jgi:hypothetical protein
MSDPAEHARLSPSGSKKWFACPGSITLEESIPNRPTTYSDEGTACHTVAAECLTKQHHRASALVGELIPVNSPSEPPRYVKFTDEMADMVQGYVDCIRALGTNNLLLVEQRVDFSDFAGVADQFGTADAIVFDEQQGELQVHDAKFGHTPVGVESNTQLMIYALGALKRLTEQGESLW